MDVKVLFFNLIIVGSDHPAALLTPSCIVYYSRHDGIHGITGIDLSNNTLLCMLLVLVHFCR